MTRIFRFFASEMIVCRISEFSPRSPTLYTNERSIFKVSKGSRCRIAERRIPGAEIVDRELHADVLELVEDVDRVLGVFHRRALGDLELQGLRPAIFDDSSTASTSSIRSSFDRCLPEMFTLTIRSLYAGEMFCHFCELLASFIQDPDGDRLDQPRLLGDRDELVRRDHPELAVMPSQQRLESDEMSVLKIDDRLVVHRQLVAVDRTTQVHLEADAFEEFRTQFFCKHRRPVVAFLGVVHRDVGVAKDLFRRVVFRVARGDADR